MPTSEDPLSIIRVADTPYCILILWPNTRRPVRRSAGGDKGMQQVIQQTGTANTYEGTQRVIPQTGAASISERFLEMPVPIVLTAMWLAGTALLGVGVLTFYLLAATVVGA